LIADVAKHRRAIGGTHIGVLSVHTGDQVGEAMLLLVFVWDKDGIRIERALMDLEACFVCNPVAIPESRRGRSVISGHIMDEFKMLEGV